MNATRQADDSQVARRLAG